MMSTAKTEITTKTAKVAILLSAYNGEKYIKTQVDSILAQKDINPFSLYIRDDGSTDNTPNILTEMQETHNDIKVILGHNIGLVGSFFELLRCAYEQDFDFYSFSDQDDYWLPDKLSTAIYLLQATNTGDRADHKSDHRVDYKLNSSYPLLYSACSTLVDENLEHSNGTTQIQLRDITFYNTAIQNFCPGHNQVLNKALAERILSNTRYSHEIYSHDLWITNVAAVTGKIIFDNTPHVLYRQHNNNQLRYGKSKVGWFIDHVKRLFRKREGCKIATQLKYFVECYEHYLTQDQAREIDSFFASQETLAKRINYILKSKLYRQKKFETVLFIMIYLLGGYTVNASCSINLHSSTV